MKTVLTKAESAKMAAGYLKNGPIECGQTALESLIFLASNGNRVALQLIGTQLKGLKSYAD